MKNKNLVFLFCLFVLFACHEENESEENPTSCEQVTILNSELYLSAPSDELTINSLEINGDCLKINFSSSGCSGNSWELKLIDSEDVMESDPSQRNLRLSLKNEEMCEAYITKELTFDISNLRVGGSRVKLNLTNSNKYILYEY